MEMTATEKRRATLQRKKETYKNRQAQLRQEQELIRANLIAVLQSEDARPEDRLRSSELLLEMDFRTSH